MRAGYPQYRVKTGKNSDSTVHRASFVCPQSSDPNTRETNDGGLHDQRIGRTTTEYESHPGHYGLPTYDRFIVR
jgi:hypothetical protein